MLKSIILIPSRLAATRLPNKPLLKIKGKSLISLVYKNAANFKAGDVYVVTGDKKILSNVKKEGGKAILTKKKHKTGTDRIFEATQRLKNLRYDYVLNLQGDEPNIDIKDIKKLVKLTRKNKFGMATLACKISNLKETKDKNLVKVFTKKKLNFKNFSTAQYFYRKTTFKNLDNLYHHIGVYIYKKDILKKIVSLNQTISEKKLKLEQLRALDNKIPIHVILAKKKPIGVDTLKDYLKIKKLLEKKDN